MSTELRIGPNHSADVQYTNAPALAAGEFLGHPRGLAYIAFAEAWERFSFYGMQALLMLYMTGYLLEPGTIEQVAGFAGVRRAIEGMFGPLSTQALASQIFGLYVALIYFVPVLGGLLGDRVTGRRRAVLMGAVSMAIGHFMMAFEVTFLLALSALIVGSGLLKGNLAAQVGNLYARDDRRRERAYTVYVSAINVGAFVAPLVCGTLGELYGWHYGFGIAGFGMLIGIAIYLSGSRYLPPERHEHGRPVHPSLSAATGEEAASPSRQTGTGQIEATSLQAGDGRIIAALLTVLLVTSLFWIVQAQVWNIYPLWLRDHVDRSLPFDLAIPVTWFQSLDAMTVLLLAPVAILFWRRQAERGVEPDDLKKIGIGCAAMAVTCLLLSAGQWTAGDRQVQLLWPVLFHFGVAIAYLYVAPIALALVSRAAPAAVNAMMVGTYYLGIFIGGIVSGWLGRFYEPLQPTAFWALHAVVAIAGTLSIALLRRPFAGVLKLG